MDGTTVPANQYYVVGAYTVADYLVSAGTHVIASNRPSASWHGYTGAPSYAIQVGSR